MPFDHFDLIAGLYDRAAKFNPPAQLLDLLALPVNGRLLDVGGGTGHVAEVLRGLVREAVVADLSQGMLRHAADKGLLLACTPAEHLPFASRTFDRVIMVDALHHVHNQPQTVNELWRVLAPCGKIVIIEPDIHRFAVKMIAIIEKLFLMRSHFLSADKIAALFASQNSLVRIISVEFNVWICAEKVKVM